MLVSYDMTRLMRLPRAPETYVVTLNATDRVDPSTVIAKMDYEHPAYTPASVAAQKRLPDLNDGRIAFAGAYHGWGFHEDGCASGVRAAAVARGRRGDDPGVRSDEAAALYDVLVEHRRSQTLDDAFTHRMYLWLVDLDDLPRFRVPLIAFRGADHLGHPERSIRENLDAFLAAHGRPRPARVLMLAHPRTLGYVFNPITLYWCHDAAGALTDVVAEVHNTYGGRHHYLLEVDDAGPRARRQGLLRLAVLPRRRRVPDEGPRAGRDALGHRRAPASRRRRRAHHRLRRHHARAAAAGDHARTSCRPSCGTRSSPSGSRSRSVSAGSRCGGVGSR